MALLMSSPGVFSRFTTWAVCCAVVIVLGATSFVVHAKANQANSFEKVPPVLPDTSVEHLEEATSDELDVRKEPQFPQNRGHSRGSSVKKNPFENRKGQETHNKGKKKEDNRHLSKKKHHSSKKRHHESKKHKGKMELKDYRAFLIAHHPDHGYLLLQASKREKGVHFQIPGGHVDLNELRDNGNQAFVVAVARELWEETGIDFRDRLDRLRPADLGGGKMELKGRRYFLLELEDSDLPASEEGLREAAIRGSSPPVVSRSMGGHPVFLRLSSEHTGFTFEKDPSKAADLIYLHSGGKNSEAFRRIFGIL